MSNMLTRSLFFANALPKELFFHNTHIIYPLRLTLVALFWYFLDRPGRTIKLARTIIKPRLVLLQSLTCQFLSYCFSFSGPQNILAKSYQSDPAGLMPAETS
jgi:hypothetical protein